MFFSGFSGFHYFDFNYTFCVKNFFLTYEFFQIQLNLFLNLYFPFSVLVYMHFINLSFTIVSLLKKLKHLQGSIAVGEVIVLALVSPHVRVVFRHVIAALKFAGVFPVT